MQDVIAEFSYDRFLVGHTNGLDYHYIAFTRGQVMIPRPFPLQGDVSGRLRWLLEEGDKEQ